MSKFKVGDKVRCIRSYDSPRQYTRGDTFTVIDTSRIGWIRTRRDRDGKENGWGAENFELVERALEDWEQELLNGTTFKPGDRVAVAFEDVINSVIDDIAYFNSGIHSFAAPLSSLTKLTDPIPTADGAVIRIDSPAGQVFERDVANGWWATGSDLPYRVEEVQEIANEYGGFTVLYAGDES